MKKRSMPVQRELPRPAEMNPGIMRKVGPNDAPLSDLQKVSFSHRGSLVSLHLCMVYRATVIASLGRLGV